MSKKQNILLLTKIQDTRNFFSNFHSKKEIIKPLLDDPKIFGSTQVLQNRDIKRNLPGNWNTEITIN